MTMTASLPTCSPPKVLAESRWFQVLGGDRIARRQKVIGYARVRSAQRWHTPEKVALFEFA